MRRLTSSVPPQSPVAWANFITGMDPSGHAIFDFIHRTANNYGPHLSTSRTEAAKRTLALGKWRVPLSTATVDLCREGRAWWSVLHEHGIPATVQRIPSNFPAEETEARTLSGLGTPDVQGSYGRFSYFTTVPPDNADAVTGGAVFRVELRRGALRAVLVGPQNPFAASGESATAEFVGYVDEANRSIRIDVQGDRIVLNEGEWSDWVRVRFTLAPLIAHCSGICRFYLKSTKPLGLYVSPVNIDPAAPALPLSTPEGYARELAEHVGPYYTQGMAEDTKALSAGVLEDEDFLHQADIVFEEQRAALEYELQRFDDGVLFAYFSCSDLVVHMFWRALDRRHPLWSEDLHDRHGNVVRDVYARLDGVLGRARAAVGEDTLLMVMSDHGFSPYRRSFDLNAWLAANGYLTIDAADEGVALDNADWARTRAYGIGLNSLYVNEVGREGRGSVAPGPAKRALLDELDAKLREVRDPLSGEAIIRTIYRTDKCYARTPRSDSSPDLGLGYNAPYRGSWATAIGDRAEHWIADNTDKWSGDHCIDADLVPGVLICSRSIEAESPSLCDLAPTILAEHGIPPLDAMLGRSVFEKA